MTHPPPYVLSSEWTKVVLRGGRPNARIADLSVGQARPSTPEADETNIEQDPLRNERACANVLRANLFNKTRNPPLSLHSTQDPACILKTWKPKSLNFDDKGICEVQVQLEGSGGPFEICAKDDARNEVFSLPFGVCSRRLVLSSSVEDWEQQLEQSKGSEWPKSWLKDMGKKDKTINFTVSLKAEPGGEPIKTIPLKAWLVYSDGLVVPNQRLLMIKNSTLELTEKRPACTIHFRIEDVSKNHQSKAFMVLVEPYVSASSSSAASDDLSSIAPACGYPVVVKSKINKKRKGRAGDEGEDEGGVSVRSKQSRVEPAQPPPELLNALSISLSESLIKNSRERAEAEARVQDLFSQMQRLNGDIQLALGNLGELSRERTELEEKFSELIAKCNIVKKPGQTLPSTVPAIPSNANEGNALPLLTSAALSMLPPPPLDPNFSFRVPEEKELVFGNSTAQALVFGGGNEDTLAMCLPSGLVRLSTGDLFSIALNTNTAHSLGTPALGSGQNQNGGEEEEEEEEDDVNDSDNGDDEPPLCTYLKSTPVEMASGEKRWLAFSDSYKLVGFFLEDGSFVDISSVRDAKWKERQEQMVLESGGPHRLDVATQAGRDRLLDQVLEIIQMQ